MQTTNNISSVAARRIYEEPNFIKLLPVVAREKCGNFYIHIFDLIKSCFLKEDIL